MMSEQSDFTIEAYGIVTPPPEPVESDEADDVGDETGDED